MNLASLPQLAQDKANHYVYGTALAAIGAVVARHFGVDPRIGAAAAAGGVAILKEVIDKATKKGTPDRMDAVATAAGALPVIAGLMLTGGA